MNYVGVIIGLDFCFDLVIGWIVVDCESYWDKKGKENIGYLKDVFGDDDLLMFIWNIYGVLLMCGMCGMYIYVCDIYFCECF